MITGNDFEEITNQMTEIFCKKNKDYGDSFSSSLDEFGLVAGIVRINDKINRIKQIYKINEIEVTEEKLEDTLLDLANYSVMTLLWLKNKERNENKR